MSDQDKESKTEQPSAKRREDALKDGGAPQSRDLSSTVSLLVGVITLNITGSFMVANLKGHWREMLGGLNNYQLTDARVYNLLLKVLFTLGWTLAPFTLVVMIAGVAASVSQTGFSFNTERLGIKLNKINPLEGVKRFFNKQAGMEGAKALVKILIVGFIAYRVLRDEVNNLIFLSDGDVQGIFEFLSHLSFKLVLHTCGVMLILAVIDLAFVKWNYLQGLKMTKQEVKEEHRQSEGDPAVKGKIKRMQFEQARRRLKKIIPTADVVITNPTHFAVALKYDRERMVAPMVLAKGADQMALRIKTLARESNIMLVENRPLARELFAKVKEGEEIPEVLYTAVAEILAYVYGLKGKI